jgi:hypothetical protein
LLCWVGALNELEVECLTYRPWVGGICLFYCFLEPDILA